MLCYTTHSIALKLKEIVEYTPDKNNLKCRRGATQAGRPCALADALAPGVCYNGLLAQGIRYSGVQVELTINNPWLPIAPRDRLTRGRWPRRVLPVLVINVLSIQMFIQHTLEHLGSRVDKPGPQQLRSKKCSATLHLINNSSFNQPKIINVLSKPNS